MQCDISMDDEVVTSKCFPGGGVCKGENIMKELKMPAGMQGKLSCQDGDEKTEHPFGGDEGSDDDAPADDDDDDSGSDDDAPADDAGSDDDAPADDAGSDDDAPADDAASDDDAPAGEPARTPHRRIAQ